MKVRKADIWSNYSTFSNKKIQLDEFARAVVRFGLSDAVLSSNDVVYLRENNLVQTVPVTFSLNPKGNLGRVDLARPIENEELRSLIFGLLHIRYFENFHFPKWDYLDDDFLRFFLGSVLLHASGEEILVRPFLSVFSSGVILLTFRRSISETTDLDSFINDEVLLSLRDFSRLSIENSLSTVFAGQIFHPTGVTITRDFEIFGKRFLDIPLDQNKGGVLTQIALKVFQIVTEIQSSVQGESDLHIAETWQKRTHVHLIEFDGQCESAAENENKFSTELVRIQNQIVHGEMFRNTQTEFENLRIFQDFGVYASSIGILVVTGLAGLRTQWPGNMPDDSLVLNNQVLADFADVIAMRYRTLLSRVKDAKDLAIVLQLQSEYLHLDEQRKTIVRFGETQNLLQKTLFAFGLEATVSELERNIELTKTKVAYLTEKAQTRLSNRVSILFGVISVPVISESILIPSLRTFGMVCPANEYLVQVICSMASILVVSVSVFFLTKNPTKKARVGTRRRKPSKLTLPST